MTQPIPATQPTGTRQSRPAASRLSGVGLVLAVFLLVWSIKLATIAQYGTDLPYWDQWAKEGELFYAPWFEQHAFWQNLFVPHNEHRIAPTLALNWGLLRIGGDQWDARVQCVASAALHALIAALLTAWAARRLRRGWCVVFAAVMVMITAPPIAWENVLGGFQSQFYFLILFSLLAIAGLLGGRPAGPAWIGGLLCAVLAAVSMGSGMLVAVPVFGVSALRLVTGTERRPAILTLTVAALYGLVGWYFRPQAPWHAVMHAHSAHEYILYAARCLAWPVYDWPALGVLFWAPYAWLALNTLRRRSTQSRPLADDLILATGLWVLIQIAAVTYSRAGGSPLPAPRYGDVCALELVVNFVALLRLTGRLDVGAFGSDDGPAAQPHDRARFQQTVLPLAWCGVVAIAVLVATREAVRGPLPQKKSDFAAYEQSVHAFVLTDDYAAFAREPLIPFPSAEWLARIIRRPSLRRLLPVSVRAPVTVAGIGNPPAPAPLLAHRETRTLTAGGNWHSPAIPGDTGWWKIETAGDMGQPGATLRWVTVEGAAASAFITPTKPAGEHWRAAYVRAPSQPAELQAAVSAPARWLAFSEPTETSSLSFWTWRLTENAGWLMALGGGLLLLSAVPPIIDRRAPPVRSAA